MKKLRTWFRRNGLPRRVLFSAAHRGLKSVTYFTRFRESVAALELYVCTSANVLYIETSRTALTVWVRVVADWHIAKSETLFYAWNSASSKGGRPMAKDPDPKSGRVAFDDRGRSTWEWRVGTGTFSRDIDTHRLRQLQEGAATTLKDEPVPPVGVDPYSATTPLAPQKTPRRTLDDMRELSEEIKRSRERK